MTTIKEIKETIRDDFAAVIQSHGRQGLTIPQLHNAVETANRQARPQTELGRTAATILAKLMVAELVDSGRVVRWDTGAGRTLRPMIGWKQC